MTIKLYDNRSPVNQVNKDIVQTDVLTGTLREESSVLRPTITIEKSSPIGFNYVYIEEFARFYFIEELTMVRNGLIRLQLKVDPLMSFSAGIKSNKAMIRKSASNFNVLINDGSLRAYQNDLYTYKEFPNGFGSNFEYVLLVAGS